MDDKAAESLPRTNARDVRRTGLFRRVERHVQGRTVGGLMELVPLLVTVVVLVFVIGKVDSFVRPLGFVSGQPWDFPGIGIIALIVIFYVVGLIVSTRLGRIVMDFKITVLNGLPVVGTIYGVTQQAASSMGSQYRFSRVVFLEWPREGMIAIGFVTGRAVSSRTGDSMAIVYIPTVPNPTSGNMAFIMEDDLLETSITVEDAMKMVFSGGIVLPDSLAFGRILRDPVPNEFAGEFVQFEQRDITLSQRRPGT